MFDLRWMSPSHEKCLSSWIMACWSSDLAGVEEKKVVIEDVRDSHSFSVPFKIF